MTTPPETEPAPGPTPRPAPAPPAKRKRFARLRKWSWRVLLLGIVARVLLAVFLEPLANFGAGFAGLSVSWRSASLSLWGLSLHIEDLVVTDAEDDDAPALLMAQDLTAAISVRDLLHGQLTVIDVAIAGTRVTVEQTVDGELRLPAAWLRSDPVVTPEAEEPDDAPLSFELPGRIHSLRVHDLRLELIDGRQQPPQHYVGTVDIDIADIGFADRAGSVLVRLHVPQICDELFVQAELETSATRAKATWRGAVRGWRPERFDLPDTVIDAIYSAHVVDLGIDGEITAEVLPAAPRFPALQGTCNLKLALDGIERTTLQASCGPALPTGLAGAGNPGERAGGLTMPFALTLHSNDLVDELVLDAGRLEFRDGGTAIGARLRANGLTAKRFLPLLADAGLTLPPAGLDLQADLDADFGESMSLSLDKLTLGSAGEQLLDLKRVAVRDLRSTGTALAIGAIELLGPEVPLRREADGTLAFAGLRFKPPASSPTDDLEPDTGTAPDAPASPQLPELRLGSLQWSGARIELRDESTSPAGVLTLDDIRLRADGITVGADAPPGRLALSMRLPGVAERISTELRLTPAADGLATELELRATGLTGEALAPWLEPLGVRSELTAGTFTCDASADVRLQPEGIACELHLVDLALVDGDRTLLSMGRLDGTGVRVAEHDFAIGSWTIAQPFLALRRDDEAIHALGLRLASAPAAPAPDNPAVETAPSTEASNRGGNRRQLKVPDMSNPRLRHGPLRVEGARVTWRNDSRSERTWDLGLDVSVGENDGTGKALPLTATVSLPGVLESFDFGGTVVLTPARSEIDARLAVTGIRGEGLVGLLPPGMSCTLAAGQLEMNVAAKVETSPSNSNIDASVRGLRLLEGDAELAAIDEIELHAPELQATRLHVLEARVGGVRAEITLTPTALQLPGFSIAATAASPPTSTPAAANGDQPVARPNRAPMELSRFQLDALSLAIERIVVHDRRGAEAAPLVLQADLKLREPWLGEPSTNQPTALTVVINGQCQPLGALLAAELSLTPFALSPTLTGSFAVRGLDTTKLVDVAPASAQQLRGDATALELTAALHGEINLKRRNPGTFDFGRPFGGELVVEDLVLRDAATDRTFASVRAIDAIVRAIDPQSGAVLLRSLDIDEPMFQAERREDGLHVAGFLLPPAPPVAAPVAADRQRATANESGAELAIDRVRVYGIDFDFRDATTSPPTHLSFDDSDVEVQRFSTRALTEPRPLSFTAALRGGDIALPERVVGSSLLAGMLGSATDMVTGGSNEHELVQRPMVDHITVRGQIKPYPVLSGNVQADIDRLELTAFSGLANESGVDISDGLYDGRIDLDFKGYDGIDVRSMHVLSYLGLSEPANGPISTYLRLPAPLQTVLFLLRNNDGEQRLPLVLRIPSAGLSGADIADLVAEALTRIITASVGSAPGRVASTITGVLFGGDTSVPEVTAAADFEPGSPLPATVDFDDLLAKAEADPTLTIVLRHALGTADLAHAEQLANPAEDVVLATVHRLQTSRRELIERRAPIARDVLALYSASETQDALRREIELRAVDTRLGEVQTALALALGMLDEESPRVVQRRTRAAAVELAQARLDAMVADLRQRSRRLGEDRFERRAGRGTPVTGLVEGRVQGSLRRRSAPLDTSTPVPPVVDRTNNPFNKPFATDSPRGPYDHESSSR